MNLSQLKWMPSPNRKEFEEKRTSRLVWTFPLRRRLREEIENKLKLPFPHAKYEFNAGMVLSQPLNDTSYRSMTSTPNKTKHQNPTL